MCKLHITHVCINAFYNLVRKYMHWCGRTRGVRPASVIWCLVELSEGHSFPWLADFLPSSLNQTVRKLRPFPLYRRPLGRAKKNRQPQQPASWRVRSLQLLCASSFWPRAAAVWHQEAVVLPSRLSSRLLMQMPVRPSSWFIGASTVNIFSAVNERIPTLSDRYFFQ